MSDSLELLKRRMNVGAAPSGGATSEEADEDSCLGFGYLRGTRDRALFLEFRFADGNHIAYPYSWLGPCKYDPSRGMLLKFVGDLTYVVLVEGSNLNALMKDGANLYQRGIQRHRVTWIREMTGQQIGRAGAAEVTIERIRTLSYRPDEEPTGIAWFEAFRALENRM